MARPRCSIPAIQAIQKFTLWSRRVSRRQLRCLSGRASAERFTESFSCLSGKASLFDSRHSGYSKIYVMEQAGIEPASESSSITVSPITVSVLTFPTSYVHLQTYDFSSLLFFPCLQALARKCSASLMPVPNAADDTGLTAAIRQRVLIYYQRLYLMDVFTRSPSLGWLP